MHTQQLISVPRPSPPSTRRSVSPKPRPSHPLPSELISLSSTQSEQARAQPTVDLLTNLPSPTLACQDQEPALGVETTPRTDLKDSIMSLYSSQPQYGAYTAQGMPVNVYYYQQQQQAAMRMVQQQQHQVRQVQEQMHQLKLRQQQPQVTVGNGRVPSSNPGGGHTLNPHLW